MSQIILDSANDLIQGDFDNATLSQRTRLQTSTTNATTGVYVVPNGTANSASVQISNAADPTNASKLVVATNASTDTQIVSGANGSGTYLPLSFYTNNDIRFQMGNAGELNVRTAPGTVSSGSAGQVLTSGGPGAGVSWTTVGGQINTQVFTSPGTWTKPSSATAAVVYVAGGAGGGGSGGTGLNQTPGYAGARGGDGGHGGFVAAYVTGLTGPVAVTVGTGGTGATFPGTGASGGTSSFGPFVSATGGTGGTAAVANTAGTAGTAGTATVSTGTDLRSGNAFSVSGAVFALTGTSENSAGPYDTPAPSAAVVWSAASPLQASARGDGGAGSPQVLSPPGGSAQGRPGAGGVSGVVIVEFVG